MAIRTAARVSPKKTEPPVKGPQDGQNQKKGIRQPPRRVLAAATAKPEAKFPEITLPVKIKGNWYTVLMDYGTLRNYIRPKIVNMLRLP